jgi:hypothetical protein
MNSKALPQFWKLYKQLPKEIRLRAAKAYRIWREHPRAPGLQFKRVNTRTPVYSVRFSDSHRVLGLLEGDTIYWFWIGDHDEYEQILKTL